jgi:SAM-dependent methyltransferase
MPVRSRADPAPALPASGDAAGRFGPEAYADWRASWLGDATEALEQDLVLRLAGDVSGRRVLDVGCGDGSLAAVFRQKGAASVAGCDIDPKMIMRARARTAQQDAAIAYAIADAQRLPFRSESFDIVTIVTVLAFLSRPECALAEIARVLRPGGRLVIGDLGKWSFWAVSRRVRGRLGRAPLWKRARFRSAGELRALVRRAGLSLERVCGAVYYPRCRAIAKLMAPLDPALGKLTTLGAAFLAVQATKESGR